MHILVGTYPNICISIAIQKNYIDIYVDTVLYVLKVLLMEIAKTLVIYVLYSSGVILW